MISVATFARGLMLASALLIGCKSSGDGRGIGPAAGAGAGSVGGSVAVADATGVTGGGGGGGGPADVYLEADDYVIAEDAWTGGTLNLRLAKKVSAPESNGLAKFMRLSDGREVTTRYFWKTRRATEADLVIGPMVAVAELRSEGQYRAPTTRVEATSHGWFMARLVSVAGLPEGHVIVSSGYIVRRDALRLIEGMDTLRLTMRGSEDEQFVEADDYVIAEDAWKGDTLNLQLAKQISAPGSNGLAKFMRLSDGGEVTTRYFWKTRRATEADLVIGPMVAVAELRSEGQYRAPTTRVEATSHGWFMARLVSVAGLPEGHVIVSGGYIVRRDALRIIEGMNTLPLTPSGNEDA